MKEYEVLEKHCEILLKWLIFMTGKLSRLSKEDNLDQYWILSKKWDHYYAIHRHLQKVRYRLMLKEYSVRVQTPQERKKGEEPV